MAVLPAFLSNLHFFATIDRHLNCQMVKILRKEGLQRVMRRMPSNKGGQSFIEYALIIILISIAILSILLIFGDDIRTVINDLLQQWFPAQPETLRNLIMPT